jgi:organic radical activating enzyme
MDSIYWVVSKACNQRCPHCYNNSGPDAPGLDEAEVERVVDNLPDPDRIPVGQIILSGGEVLAWPELMYHALERLVDRYDPLATRLAVQTNGDMLDAAHLDRMLSLGVRHVSIASQDKFHLPQSRRRAAELEELFATRGVRKRELSDPKDKADERPEYAMWGANPETWIGPLWPRGRAYVNNLSTATTDDDFCGQWSGAKGFLDYDKPGGGCEVSLQLADVYPCCPMTCRPIGDLLQEPLLDLLDRCKQHPVYRALNAGEPERMGESMGIPESHGIERSRALGNHCLWCDEFFTKHAPDLLAHGTRTERGTIELTINGKRAAGVAERDIRREFQSV